MELLEAVLVDEFDGAVGEASAELGGLVDRFGRCDVAADQLGGLVRHRRQQARLDEVGLFVGGIWAPSPSS